MSRRQRESRPPWARRLTGTNSDHHYSRASSGISDSDSRFSSVTSVSSRRRRGNPPPNRPPLPPPAAADEHSTALKKVASVIAIKLQKLPVKKQNVRSNEAADSRHAPPPPAIKHGTSTGCQRVWRLWLSVSRPSSTNTVHLHFALTSSPAEVHTLGQERKQETRGKCTFRRQETRENRGTNCTGNMGQNTIGNRKQEKQT